MTDEQIFTQYFAAAITGLSRRGEDIDYIAGKALDIAKAAAHVHREQFPFVSPRIEHASRCPFCDGLTKCETCNSTGIIKQ